MRVVGIFFVVGFFYLMEALQGDNPPHSVELDAVELRSEGGSTLTLGDAEATLILYNFDKSKSWKLNRTSFDMERIDPNRDFSKSNSYNSIGKISSLQGESFVELPVEEPPVSDGLDGAPAATPALFVRTFSNREEGSEPPDMKPPVVSGHGGHSAAFMALSALGVVFGDIGTSPLYTVQTIFSYIPATEDNILGAISSIFWLLNISVTLKYVTVIMQADNRGEGGIMALTALASRSTQSLTRPWWKTMTMMIGTNRLTEPFAFHPPPDSPGRD